MSDTIFPLAAAAIGLGGISETNQALKARRAAGRPELPCGFSRTRRERRPIGQAWRQHAERQRRQR